MNDRSTLLLEHHLRECRHIHRHSRESRNPKAIGSKCVFASYRILTDSGFPLSPE